MDPVGLLIVVVIGLVIQYIVIRLAVTDGIIAADRKRGKLH